MWLFDVLFFDLAVDRTQHAASLHCGSVCFFLVVLGRFAFVDLLELGFACGIGLVG